MRLLIVTSRWPLAISHEFLDDEILKLAEVFEQITIAPMRPDGPLCTELPPGVEVDRTLATHLESTAPLWGKPARAATILRRCALPLPGDPGASAAELAADCWRANWLTSLAVKRADSRSVAQWARRRPPPDLAYSFWLGAGTSGLGIAWPDVPLVSRAHGGDVFAGDSGWSTIPLQAHAVASASLVASVSAVGMKELQREHPAHADRIVVRHLGIHDVGRAEQADYPRKIGIVSSSAVDANKRVWLIAEVAKYLARDGSPVNWVHYGDGPKMAEVEERLVDSPPSLQANLKGRVPVDVVRQELRTGGQRVFINLSLAEGAPVSLIEAQSAGLPVLATAVGGTPEVACDRWNELVAPETTVPELAQAVLRAQARPSCEVDQRRQHWRENYEANSIYTSWADELAGIATGRRG